MGTVIRKILFAFAAIATTIVLLLQMRIEVVVDEGFYLIDSKSSVYNFKPISWNSVECDVSALSNIIINMKDDGFSFSEPSDTKKGISIISKRGDEKYRFIYENQKLTVISIDYVKSDIPLTYISEEVSLLNSEKESVEIGVSEDGD